MLTITRPDSTTKGPHIKTETDGSKTHYLGEVKMALTMPQEQPATKRE